MLLQHTRIGAFLQEACGNENTNFRIDRSLGFSGKVSKYQKMLQIIKMPAKEMQTRHHALSDCRDDLDMLFHDAREHKDTHGHASHSCKLGDACIAQDSEKLPSLSFAMGVIKTQNNDMQSMTGLEDIASSCLRIDSAGQEGQSQSNNSSSANSTHQERRELFKKARTGKCIYFHFQIKSHDFACNFHSKRFSQLWKLRFYLWLCCRIRVTLECCFVAFRRQSR